jgi:hypothetical protein
MTGPGFQINSHVSNLNRFLPFTADFDQLYEEHIDEDSVSLPTRALGTACELVDSGAKLILLTGDAGHGKTHICRRLLEQALGFSATDAFAAIRTGDGGTTASDGTVDLGRTAAGTQLRIIRDLSELSEVLAAQRLVDALHAPDRTTVCCANEGRLRVVLDADQELVGVRHSLDIALSTGRVDFDGLAVLDLNNQAVAARPDGLVDRLLRDWITDGRRWRICGQCAAAPRCPIFANRSMLVHDQLGSRRRNAFASLFRLVELGGSTITIRELLASTALAITGGLHCLEVHDQVGKKRHDRWQADHLYFEAVFGRTLSPGQRERLRVLRPLGLVDPGSVATRFVDDELVAGADESPPDFSPVEDLGVSGRAHSGRDAQRAAHHHRRLVEFLRRRSFFDDAHGPSIAERAGLRYAADFEAILNSASTTRETKVRDRLLRGLEAVQGIRREGGDGSFYVIDPAFGTTGVARVIATDLEATDIRALSLSAWWSESSEGAGEVCALVDWLERRVVLVIATTNGDAFPLLVDLLEFEFLMRCADGLADIGFFDATVRRLRAKLARVAESSIQAGNRIHLVVGGDVRRLSIDVDNKIRAARAS